MLVRFLLCFDLFGLGFWVCECWWVCCADWWTAGLFVGCLLSVRGFVALVYVVRWLVAFLL